MDPALLLRTARRQLGLDQRAFAEQAGISPRALQDAEAGRCHPSWRTLARAAEAAGLELDLVPAARPASSALRHFLVLSTAERLALALVRDRPVLAALSQVTRCGHVHLAGPAAVPVWVPGAAVPTPLPVRLHGVHRPYALSPHLDVEEVPGTPTGQLVPVRLRQSGVFHVDDPSALSLREDCAAHVPALRAAVRCLHEGRPLDRADRQRPAHRDPDERREAARLYHLTALRRAALPDALDSRAWRLEGTVSLAQWLAEGRPERG